MVGKFKYSLNIFILHRLRNKFVQLILIPLDTAFWELHQYSRRMCGPMKNPKVETHSWDSNSGPYDCKADTTSRPRTPLWETLLERIKNQSFAYFHSIFLKFFSH